LLLELRVKNLGIIEDIDWQLDTGLNIITGETGAGKSLIIDAVELLLNASAGEEVIHHDAAEAGIALGPAIGLAVGAPVGRDLGPGRGVVRRQAEVGRALEDGDLGGLSGDLRDRLDRRGAGADHRDAAAGEVDALMRPAAGVVGLALEAGGARQVDILGH